MNYAVSTDRSLSQWIDLGIHLEVCMTQPNTCGENDGAIALWVNVIDCPNGEKCGIITSIQDGKSLGFQIRCSGENIRYSIVRKTNHLRK